MRREHRLLPTLVLPEQLDTAVCRLVHGTVQRAVTASVTGLEQRRLQQCCREFQQGMLFVDQMFQGGEALDGTSCLGVLRPIDLVLEVGDRPPAMLSTGS